VINRAQKKAAKRVITNSKTFGKNEKKANSNRKNIVKEFNALHNQHKFNNKTTWQTKGK
jgi:hypothetical protein